MRSRSRFSVSESFRSLLSRAVIGGGLLAIVSTMAPTASAAEPRPVGTHCASAGEACEGLRPGALLIIAPAPSPDGQNYCTFGFILQGRDGQRYAVSAGHCLGWLLAEGEERSWPDGSGIFAYTADGQRVGEFVYAIRTREIVSPGLPPDADFSLVRLDRGIDADPEVCAFGGPTGIDDRIVTDPAPLEMRWFGITPAGARTPPMTPGPHAWLLPARSGYALGMPRERIVQVAGHAFFSDSGGPVLTADGQAVGLISGPPAVEDPDELPTDGHAGSFIVTRLAPQLARASEVLGVQLSLCCPGRGLPHPDGGAPTLCGPCTPLQGP